MKYLKSFENIKSRQDIKNEIEYEYIKNFDSEEHFNYFILGANDVDDLEDVNWDYVPDDVISELWLEDKYDISKDELREIVVEILTDVDLDKCQDIRDGTYDDFLIRKKSEKYNL